MSNFSDAATVTINSVLMATANTRDDSNQNDAGYSLLVSGGVGASIVGNNHGAHTTRKSKPVDKQPGFINQRQS